MCGSWWRLPLLLVLVLAAILWSRVRNLRDVPHEATNDKTQAAADAASHATVSLAINFGDGRQRDINGVAWHDGMTVADIFSSSPGIQVSQKGSAESALLTAIDGIANEGSDGRNWTYAVNGQVADRSFAVYQLRPGDRVLWTFGQQK
ncbi:MAG TPA: DUF4430 domain-containing protein [Lacipirellulaceae bacterium]|nr:DUF4430 domain-containing protein [Lacipirellulaceae bacterium]